MFGATVYTFSLILACSCSASASAAASAPCSRAASNARDSRSGWVQMLLCGAIAWAAYTVALSLPFWPIDPSISTSPWYNFPLDLARAFWVVLPASILWGASFPLALASVAAKGQDPGAPGRRRLRGQHRRRDRGRARRQPADGDVARHAALAAGAHHPVRPVRAAGARAAAIRTPKPGVRAPRGRARCRSSSPRSARRSSRVTCRQIPKLLVAYGRYAATRAHPEHRRHLHGRRVERVGRRLAPARRRAELSQRRQGPGLERAAGHAPAAHARTSDDADSEEPEEGAGHRMRRRRDGRRGLDRSLSRARDDRRDRAARPTGRLEVFRRAQLQRRDQSQGARAARRCAPLPVDDEGEVRRDHVGSARPVGEGRRDALHARVLRGRQAAPQPGRRGHAVRPVVREQPRRREERDRHVHGGVPERRGLGQHAGRPWLRSGR